MDDRMISIIEDYALMEDFLIHTSMNIRQGKPIPDYVPSLNSSLLMDALTTILEELRK